MRDRWDACGRGTARRRGIRRKHVCYTCAGPASVRTAPFLAPSHLLSHLPSADHSAFSDIPESGGGSRRGWGASERDHRRPGDGDTASEASSEASGGRDVVQEVLARGKELLLQSFPSILGFTLAWLSLSLLLPRGRPSAQVRSKEWEEVEEWEDEEEEEE